MKRRSPAKPAFSGSGEASAAANQKAKDEGKQQQRRQDCVTSPSSSDDEISTRRSISSGEETTGRSRKRERQQLDWDDVGRLSRMIDKSLAKKKKRIIDKHKHFWNKNNKQRKSRWRKMTFRSYSTENEEDEAQKEESLWCHPIKSPELYTVGVSRRFALLHRSLCMLGDSLDQPASNREGDEQVATEASATPLSKVVSDGSNGDISKEGFLDDAKLLSRSEPVEAQQQASFDEETSTATPLSKVVSDGSTGDITKKGCLDDAKLLIRSGSVEAQQEASFDKETSTATLLSKVVSDGSTGDISKEGCLDDAKLLSRSGSVEAQEPTSFDEETRTLLKGVDILKEGCLDDAELLNRSGSIEAQEQASFDEETSTRLKVEDSTKLKFSSCGEFGSIVLGEDELSGKNTSCGDLGKMVAQDEDGQHSENIRVQAVDHKQGIGRAAESTQALLEMDDDTILEKMSYYFDQFKLEPLYDCDDLPMSPYEPQMLTEVYEQLALYRIRGYQLSLDQQLVELDDVSLKKHYSSTDLYEERYFQHYEESLGWYFDPELCENPEFDDYQRLVLYNHGEFCDWEHYCSTLNTFKDDQIYIEYYEALVKKTEWIEDHLEYHEHQVQWNRVENVAKLQALQIAADIPYVSLPLVLFAFNEHMWSILFDRSLYTRMDCVYFEIWKRVAKLKMDFREALLEMQRENTVPLRALEIEYELKDVPRTFYMKNDYDAYIAGIDETASDDDAHQHIMEAVVEMNPKPKMYLDYIKEKIDIAKHIGLFEKVSRPCQSNVEAQVARD